MERSEYDIMGNKFKSQVLTPSETLLSTSFAGYDHNNEMIWQQSSDPNNTLVFDYNASGKLKASWQSLSQVKDGRIEASGGAYTIYDYDLRGHLIKEIDPLGNCTYRSYNAVGRIETETKEGLTHQYYYESGGLVSEIILPNKAKTTRKYSTNGLLISETHPDGTTDTYIYDFFGRVISKTQNGITWDIHYEDDERKLIQINRGSGKIEVHQFDPR
jgi:YD repeat-containing protein